MDYSHKRRKTLPRRWPPINNHRTITMGVHYSWPQGHNFFWHRRRNKK